MNRNINVTKFITSQGLYAFHTILSSKYRTLTKSGHFPFFSYNVPHKWRLLSTETIAGTLQSAKSISEQMLCRNGREYVGTELGVNIGTISLIYLVMTWFLASQLAREPACAVWSNSSTVQHHCI